MKLFKFENYKLTISEEALLIKAFRDIYKRDRSPDKQKAILELGIVYFLCDPRSEYSWITSEEEKLAIIKEHEGLDKSWTIDPKLREAMEVYRELTTTVSSLLLEDVKIAVHNARKFLRDLDLSEVDDKGKPKYTINSFIGAIKDVPELVRRLSEAEKALIKDIEEESRRRGNKLKGVTEDGYDQYLQ